MQNHVEKCNELNILSLFSPISCSGSPFRRSLLDVFLGKVVQKICSNFKGESSCRSAVLIKLQSNFIEITFRHGCSPVNLLHIFKTPFPKNTSEWLLLPYFRYSLVYRSKCYGLLESIEIEEDKTQMLDNLIL